jgi:hypothetical protein
MIQRQLKLRLKPKQLQQLDTWLWHLTGVYNWAVRKIELDAKDGIYYTPKAFHNLLADHGKTLGLAESHTSRHSFNGLYRVAALFQKTGEASKAQGAAQ